MTETDDKLLKQFFSEQKQEVKDNGFSRRVMRNLPGRNHRLIQVWGTVCTVLCVILFFAFGGLQATISTAARSFCIHGTTRAYGGIRSEISLYRHSGTRFLRSTQGMVYGLMRK